jgi:thiol-disulfide isomerase/thioredoxin
MIRNYSGILVALIAVIGLVLAPSMYFLSSGPTKAISSSEGQTSPTTSLIENGNTQNHFMVDKSQFKKAPEFTGTTGYINTPSPIKLADLKGKVVLVHFWTYTCINCIHTIPHLNDWYQKYSNRGLVIVGVQAPEFKMRKISIM